MGDVDRTYVHCHEACQHQNEQASGCHTACLQVGPIGTLLAHIRAGSYSYEPPPTEEKRRVCRIRDSYATILKVTLPQLPLELCDRIARFSLRPRAIQTVQELLSRRQSTGSCVSIPGELWARHAVFQGVRYIISLSNQPDETHDHVICQGLGSAQGLQMARRK